ncbi:MAG: hypothetical protein M3N49_00060 [Candidatus Eremiobacteraeota bacterium]|nr:hypothetical protein [Candidatus Eremiobacteraeota bacterium]
MDDQTFDSRRLLFGDVFTQRLDTSRDQEFQYGLAEGGNPIPTFPFRVVVRNQPAPASAESNTVHVTVSRTGGHLVADPPIATVFQQQNISWHFGDHESARPFAVVARDPVTPSQVIFESDALGDGAVYAKNVSVPGTYQWTSVDVATGGPGPFSGSVTVRRAANAVERSRLMLPPAHYVLRNSDVLIYEGGRLAGRVTALELLLGQPIVWAFDTPDVQVGLIGGREFPKGVNAGLADSATSSVRRSGVLSRRDLVGRLRFAAPHLEDDLLDPSQTTDSLISMLSYAVVDLRADLEISSVRRDHVPGACAFDVYHTVGTAVEVSKIGGLLVANALDAVRRFAIAMLAPTAVDTVGVGFGGAIGDVIYDIPPGAIPPGKVVLQGGSADALHLHAKA